mgnify:FL=1
MQKNINNIRIKIDRGNLERQNKASKLIVQLPFFYFWLS